MNIAFFLTPKYKTAYIRLEDTLRQGLEKMRYHGYSAIPVIDSKNQYVGTISEGDFLWYLVDEKGDDLRPTSIKNAEEVCVKEILREDKNPPVRITASIEELLTKSMNQSFIPVIDDLGTYIGIVTRNHIIQYFYEHHFDLDLTDRQIDHLILSKA